MRCNHLIERNGYFTGLRCKRMARWRISVDDYYVKCFCTQHKNLEVNLPGGEAYEIEEITE